MHLLPNTVLQRASQLAIQLDSSNMAWITTPEGGLQCGPHSLAVLDTFAQPRSLSDGLQQLRRSIRSLQEWIDLTNTLAQLHQAGLLRDETGMLPDLTTDELDYYLTPDNVATLNSRSWVEHFLKAIREVVEPDDVVVDVGAGTGVFSIAAAHAGARHVYAIESGRMAQLAREMIVANGLSDRITVLEDSPSRLTLPERADVLICESLASSPLSQYGHSVLLDARQRFLKSDAAIIPSRASVYGLPLHVPQSVLAQHTFTPEVIDNWREWYDLDFTPYIEAAGRVNHIFNARMKAIRTWQPMSEPVLLAEIDMQSDGEWTIDVEASAKASADGQCTAVLSYYTFQLGPTTTVTTYDPLVTDDSTSHTLYILDQQPFLQAGQDMTLTYRHHVPGTDSRVGVVGIS